MSRSLVPVLTPHGSLRLDGLDDAFVLERALADRLEKSFGRGAGHGLLQLGAGLAVFNLLPIPPLDGGRILVGLLPDPLSRPLAALEPYGMLILIAALLILPVLGDQTGINLNVVWQAVTRLTNFIIGEILRVTGAG